MKLSNFFGHLHTVGQHRRLVRKYCFKLGLYWQGLTHDLSKYSPTEFWPSVECYLGHRSPIHKQRTSLGYSTVWMHHKGRNRHHFEYWTDYNLEDHKMVAVPMPPRYFAEMICDRIAASRTYNKKNYNDGMPLEYHLKSKEQAYMNKETVAQLEEVLTMLRDRGEAETLKYIKHTILKK